MGNARADNPPQRDPRRRQDGNRSEWLVCNCVGPSAAPQPQNNHSTTQEETLVPRTTPHPMQSTRSPDTARRDSHIHSFIHSNCASHAQRSSTRELHDFLFLPPGEGIQFTSKTTWDHGSEPLTKMACPHQLDTQLRIHQGPRKRHSAHRAQHPCPSAFPHQCCLVRNEGWDFPGFGLGELPDEVHNLTAPSAMFYLGQSYLGQFLLWPGAIRPNFCSFRFPPFWGCVVVVLLLCCCCVVVVVVVVLLLLCCCCLLCVGVLLPKP